MTQKAFYNSAAWRKMSKAFLLSKNYICERCGAPAEIAHHRQYLNPANINNPTISMNPANLESLCLECHNKEHFSNGGAISAGYGFDGNGELVKFEREGNEHE